jgi:hypothetical protein
MANLCSNRLRVSGSAEDVASLRAAIAGVDDGRELAIDFDSVLPTPPELRDRGTIESEQARDLVARYDAADDDDRVRMARQSPVLAHMLMQRMSGKRVEEIVRWDAQVWREHNWGSRWTPNADSIRVESPSPSELIIQFDSAGTPPLPVIAAMADKFPALDFELLYSEPDNDIVGRVTFERGALVEHAQPESAYAAAALLRDHGWEGEANSWLRALGEDDD